MAEKHSIPVSDERYAKLQREAAAMGMSIETYVEFRENSRDRKLDPQFQSAAKYLFRKFPETLRKLAQ